MQQPAKVHVGLALLPVCYLSLGACPARNDWGLSGAWRTHADRVDLVQPSH